MPGYLVLPLPVVPYINRAAEKTPSKPGFTATGKVLYSTAQPGSPCKHFSTLRLAPSLVSTAALAASSAIQRRLFFRRSRLLSCHSRESGNPWRQPFRASNHNRSTRRGSVPFPQGVGDGSL